MHVVQLCPLKLLWSYFRLSRAATVFRSLAETESKNNVHTLSVIVRCLTLRLRRVPAVNVKQLRSVFDAPPVPERVARFCLSRWFKGSINKPGKSCFHILPPINCEQPPRAVAGSCRVTKHHILWGFSAKTPVWLSDWASGWVGVTPITSQQSWLEAGGIGPSGYYWTSTSG